MRAAVLMGVYYGEYQTISAANPDAIDAYSATGNAHAVAVGRIAYLLGLRGPAVAIDSACSSSLVTIHLACQSLRLRESDLALAGGVSLILRPETQIAMAKWGMLSPNGRCYSFDSRADGFVRGEGCGVIVLKRLTDAVRDGDRVLAVVRGSAVNQDGRSNGLTAPNTIAQQDVIRSALHTANVTAGSVNYIEAHGTGTGLGDPIEFEALADQYGRGEAQCALGAVKSNFGHLEAAAGIAGFIKAALSVQRSQIPPNLNFAQWNPAIDHKPTRLFVPTELSPWPAEEGPRRAAISSFGIGGTNAHVVIEQGPEPVPVSDAESASPVTTLTISGKTEQRIASWATALADWMAGRGAEVPLADIAHTVNLYRSRHNKIATVSARDRNEVVAGLRALAAGRPTPGVVAAHDVPRGKGTVFLYSGQGSQWAGMGRQLLADEPAFAAAVAELEPDFVAQVGFSLRDVLLSGEPVVGIERIQPVLVGMQLALTALWRSYGVEPDAVIGHSMGEVTAAVVSGALSPADGLKVIATRSRLMSRLSGQGAMALLELGAAEAEKLVGQYPDITVAVYAAPQQTVIAGPPEQVDAVIAVVDAQGKLARRVEVDVASHHPTVDPILADLKDALGRPEAADAADPVDQHGRSGRRCRTEIRCRLLGGQPAQPGAVQPGCRDGGRDALHVRRSQPAPAAQPRHQRHAGGGQAARRRPGVRDPDPRQPRDADVPHSAGDDSPAVGCRGPECRRHKETHRPTADTLAARPLLGGADGDQPAAGQRPPAAGHARRVAVRSRPRLHRRRRDRTRPLHARPQGARPARHARHRFRRDRLGRRQRGPRLAGHVGVRRRRGRADAAAGRVDSAHHPAHPRREGRRRDSRRNPLALGHRRLDPARRRESRSGAVGSRRPCPPRRRSPARCSRPRTCTPRCAPPACTTGRRSPH